MLFPEEEEEAIELLEGAFEMNILGRGAEEEVVVVGMVAGDVGRLIRIPELVLALGRATVGYCNRVAMMEGRKEEQGGATSLGPSI